MVENKGFSHFFGLNRTPVRTFFLFLIVNLMLISMVSALNFDNNKDYDSDKREVTITNAFGFGEELFRANLLTPHNVEVIDGGNGIFQRVGEFKITNMDKKDFKNAFGKVKTVNNFNGKETNKEVVYKYRSDAGQYSYPIQETICPNGYKNSDECQTIEVDRRYVNRYDWVEFDKFQDLPEGEVIIGVYVDVIKGEYGEWIPTFYGKEVEEWATWTANFDDDLLAYWKFDETSGSNVLDSVNGTYNGSNTNAGLGISGLIGKAYNFSITDPDIFNSSISLPNDMLVEISNFTFAIWINSSDWRIDNDTYIWNYNIGASDLQIKKLNDVSGIIAKVVGEEANLISSTVPSNDEWVFIVLQATNTTAGANATLWINDTIVAQDIIFSNFSGIATDNIIGKKNGTGRINVQGLYDEMGFWTRYLEPQEIIDLYNNGVGLTIPGVNESIVTLNSPDDNLLSGVAEIEFNCSGTSVGPLVTNMSLWTNESGTFEIKNYTVGLSENSTEVWNRSYSDIDSFIWTCQLCTSVDKCTFASDNRTISVDLTAPEINIITPEGLIDSFVFGNILNLNWTVTDLNLDTCWFEYNESNTTVACGDGNTTFLPVVDQQSLRFYSNDTLNNIGFEDTSWTYGFVENNVGFNPFALETASEQFQLNLTTDINILTIDSFLIYNNTAFRGTTSCSDGNCTLNNVVDLPLVADNIESENRTFFWNINIFNGTSSIEINTSIRFQNVSRIHLEECGGFTNTTTLNFTSFDEQNLTEVDPFIFDSDFLTWLGRGNVKRQSNFSLGSVPSAALCISPNNTYFIDGQVTYDSPNPGNYVPRNYWFQNDMINNATQDIPLYLLLSTESTSFILKVQDENLLPVADVLIYTERFYPGVGEFRIVQVAKTDDNGRSVGFFKTETVDYRFILKQNGSTVLTTNDQKIVGETAPFTLTFTIGETGGTAWDEFEPIGDLEKSLTFNSSSNIVTFVYTDTSTEFVLGNLVVERLISNGSSNVIICNQTSLQSSATLFCDLTGNESGTYSGQGIIIRESQTIGGQILIQVLFGINDFTKIVGDYGLFLGWFIILLGAFAFKFNEIAGIFMLNVTVIGVNIIGLIHFGPVFITAMIALSVFIAVVLER